MFKTGAAIMHARNVGLGDIESMLYASAQLAATDLPTASAVGMSGAWHVLAVFH